MGGSFALDIVLTVALAVTGAQVMQNADKLEHVQKITNDDALCPLYDIFISASKVPPPPPNPGETKEQYAKRMKDRKIAFEVINKGYDALECKPLPGGKN